MSCNSLGTLLKLKLRVDSLSTILRNFDKIQKQNILYNLKGPLNPKTSIISYSVTVIMKTDDRQYKTLIILNCLLHARP